MTQHPPVCDYEGSTYQSTFWDTGERAYEDGAEAIALKAQLPEHGKLLLEVGAGAGRNTPRYAGFDRIVLLDYSRTQLEQAQQRLGRSDRFVYVAADVYRLPFQPGTFDAATMIRVIHHMADAPAALAQIQTALAPGATFILEFANKRNFKAILRYWLGRQHWNPFTPEPVEFVALNYDFHPDTMLTWLSQAGFIVRGARALSYFRLGLIKRLFPTGFLVALDGMLQAIGGRVAYSPSVFVHAQKNGSGTPATIDGDVHFRCPTCSGTTLYPIADGLECPECQSAWSFRDGIYDFKTPLAPPRP